MSEESGKNKSHPEKCPECGYISPERTTKCPNCGHPLAHPQWKRIAAFLLLLLIGYGLVKCHVKMLDGLF